MSKLAYAGVIIAAAFVFGIIGSCADAQVLFYLPIIAAIPTYKIFFSKNEWNRTKAQDVGDQIAGREVPDSSSLSPDQKRILKHLSQIKEESFQLRYLDDFPTEELTSYIASQLSTADITREDVEHVVVRTYNKYFPDYSTGSGWIPPHNYRVDVSPILFSTAIKSDKSPYGNSEVMSSIDHDIWLQRTWAKQTNANEDSPQSTCCFRLALSEDDNITASQMERFWSQLQTISQPAVFEIVGNGSANTITFQLLCSQSDQRQIGNQLTTLFPSSGINPAGEDPDALREQVGDDYREKFEADFSAYGVSFGLARHYTHQLRTLTSFDKTDPLYSLINPLGEVDEGEGAVIQALIAPAGKDWQSNLEQIELMSKLDGAFKDCPASKKANSPLFAVSLKAMAFKRKKTSASSPESFLKNLENALASFKLPAGNYLSAEPEEFVEEIAKEKQRLKELRGRLHENLSQHKKSDLQGFLSSMNPQGEVWSQIPEIWQQFDSQLTDKEMLSIFSRGTYRHGFILNTQELSTLCHFPHKELEHPKLLRQSSAFAQAPEAATAGKGLLIGINEIFGKEQQVYIPEDFRFRHTYVVGKTGTGKTTFLFNMIKEDIDAGKGVGLIDPHGDLVEQVLQNIPEHRIDDVILFDPSDYERPIGFNMFQAANPQEKRQMRADILTSIKRLFDESSWGDNIDQLFRAAIATLLADEGQTHTLIDIRRLISDDVFRSQVISRINDEFLQEFWREDFTGFTQATIAAMRRRLGSILNEPEVRNVLAQPQTSFSFKEMMDTKKILLAKLSRGILGEDMSKMFGGLLVSKIQLQAMARESQPEHLRVPFYLYVDEFQNFVNESFEVILSEARKYRLCLTMAHQFTGQLPKPVYDAVFGNVGTLIAFETGVDDATALEKQMGKFSKEDIINLPRYHTFTRIGKAQDTFSMRTMPPNESETDVGERARAASRQKYGRPMNSESPQPDAQQEKEVPAPQEFIELSEPVEEVIEAPVLEPEPEKPVEAEPKPDDKDKDKKSIDFFE